MEVKDFLSMNVGDGEHSFARNSHFNRKLLDITKPYVVEAIEDLLHDQVAPLKLLRAAELGCSSGPTATSIIATIADTVQELHRRADKEPPELQFLLNDLPSNDFNSVFSGLPSFLQQVAGIKESLLSCFVMGVPGSFHGRLFPRNDLHFVHSSYSVHWLSQAPAGLVTKDGEAINKGVIYISKTSPPCVWKAYLNQFEKDFFSFLKCRYEEMVLNGRMVLILHGRPNTDPVKDNITSWHFLSIALSEMVSQGLVEEKRLDDWNVPYYTTSVEEVKDIVGREGSFLIQKLETLKFRLGEETEIDVWAAAQMRAKKIRSFTEVVIARQFGEKIINRLYDRVARLIVEELDEEATVPTSLIVVLKRK